MDKPEQRMTVAFQFADTDGLVELLEEKGILRRDEVLARARKIRDRRST